LTIGERQGSYPGMLESRRFTLALPDGTVKGVEYSGKAMEVKL